LSSDFSFIGEIGTLKRHCKKGRKGKDAGNSKVSS